MIHLPALRIRRDDGQVTVIRVFADGPRLGVLRYIRPAEALCSLCGCCDAYACAGGCAWVIPPARGLPGVCSRCAGKAAKEAG
jgi:hypothetical protein